MRYNKNLIIDLYEIKEKLDDKEKETVERFMEQYNKMYAEYRSFQEEKRMFFKNYSDIRAKSKKKISNSIETKTILFGVTNEQNI